MRRLIENIRRKNRARRERRQLRKATGELPQGWFSRLAYRIRAKNHDRLARHRAQKQLLASLAANDTAVLESLAFLLEATRREQQARSEASDDLAKRLAALEERVDAGLRLLEARLPQVRAERVDPAEGERLPEGKARRA